MKKRRKKIIAIMLYACMLCTSCGKTKNDKISNSGLASNQTTSSINENEIKLSGKIKKLDSGFSAVEFQGEDGVEDFLNQGGASSDGEVVKYLTSRLMADVNLDTSEFYGCSTLAVTDADGNRFFGRNFDWDHCDVLVVVSKPNIGYSSISTVNTDFITVNLGTVKKLALKKDELLTKVALYAPLDGMNEKGFAVSVNMISDRADIAQNSSKPDITTTTAIRMLLNKAETVDEAIKLLESYDLHASMGMMIHFAMTDLTGKSVAVEYINNEMSVIETPIVTNFYLTKGEQCALRWLQERNVYNEVE